MKNKEYHHGGFQQQNTQAVINEYILSIPSGLAFLMV